MIKAVCLPFMISSKPEHFKEGPGPVRGSRSAGPPLSWQSNFCRGQRGQSKATDPSRKDLSSRDMAESQPVWTALEGQAVPDPSKAAYVHSQVGRPEKEEVSLMFQAFCAY